MSTEPKPADSLQQLKELMMGDEQRAIAELRARLDTLDADSVERLAEELVAALRHRRENGEESFEELVAALQPGTESAIQRSVTEDKSRLSKALFPIMGPAIRNYVLDLFRGMVKDLNETIRDTTSAERIKWRFQAKLAGKSYSEYVLLRTRSFHIDEVYLMQRDTGLLLLYAARNPDQEAREEADLVSSMFTAIHNFVRDSFGKGEAGDDEEDVSELDGFTFGEREVLIEVGPAMVLAAVSHGVPPGSVREELKGVLEILHGELGGRLDHFSGDTALLESGRPALRRALLESRKEESGGGGLWRAWVFLGVIAAAVAIFWAIGFREQKRWDRFEASLRAEPGYAVTEVEPDGWWRKRLVRGIRDPLAKEPAALVGESGIEAEKVRFEFTPMASLEPDFVAKRDAPSEAWQTRILDTLGEVKALAESAATSGETKVLSQHLAGLQEQLEETRRADETKSRLLVRSLIESQFAGTAGLKVAVSEAGDRLVLSGELEPEDLVRVRAQLEPLAGLIEIDASGLGENSSARWLQWRNDLEALAIPFADGSMRANDERQIDEIVGLMQKLDSVSSLPPKFEVLAHPLIGANRQANRAIEQSRAESVKSRLVERGIDASRLLPVLSEDLERAGEGVMIRVIEPGGAADR
ncbi:MAG: hypothetical protein KDN19_20180 [Verrucomicrobiae bacterium]|nr:hypothetical protein [Verrucomicrobiae bacterium]